jgi:hypothetical protein
MEDSDHGVGKLVIHEKSSRKLLARLTRSDLTEPVLEQTMIEVQRPPFAPIRSMALMMSIHEHGIAKLLYAAYKPFFPKRFKLDPRLPEGKWYIEFEKSFEIKI